MDPEILSELRRGYRDRLKDRIETIEARLEELEAGNPEAEGILRQLAHTLRGSGGSYGYPEITASAEAVETGATEGLPELCQELLATLRAVSNQDESSI